MIRFRLLYMLTALMIHACGNKKDVPKPPPKPIAIDVMVAKNQSFGYTIDASGTIQAQEFVELKTEVSGRIVKLIIDEGSVVKAGTLLVKLNDDDLQAQLRKVESQFEIAKRNQQRLKSLLDANGLNQQEYDLAQNQVNTLASDIDYTKAMIGKTELRAPFSGLIGLRNVSIGAFVNNQMVLATLQQTDKLKVDFVLPNDYTNVLKKGMKVSIVGDKNTPTMSATITAIEPQVNAGTRNIKARAQLDQNTNNTIPLNPGAFVKVLIDITKNNTAILVPTNCIIPDTRNKKLAVIKNGKVSFVVVETGYRTEKLVEITSGINIGDTIALNGILFLKPDAAVIIKNVN